MGPPLSISPPSYVEIRPWRRWKQMQTRASLPDAFAPVPMPLNAVDFAARADRLSAAHREWLMSVLIVCFDGTDNEPEDARTIV